MGEAQEKERNVGSRSSVKDEGESVAEVAEDIHQGVESIEAAEKVFTGAMRMVGRIGGSRIANELLDKFSGISKRPEFKVFSKFKPQELYKVARIILALGCASDAEVMDQDKVLSALQNVHSASRLEQIQVAREIAPNQEARRVALQHFLDQVRPHVEAIQAQFGGDMNPPQKRALRVAFSNVFIPFKNVISSQGLEKVEDEEVRPGVILPGYETLMRQMLGADIRLDDLVSEEEGENLEFGQKINLIEDRDIVDGIPQPRPVRENATRSDAYLLFKSRLLEISDSDAYRTLQRIVGDSGIMARYEAAIDPDMAPPRLVEEARQHPDLLKMMGLANSKVAKVGVQ